MKISYEVIEPILKEENQAFYRAKKRLFGEVIHLDKTDSRLDEIKKILRIPKVTEEFKRVEKILNDFNALTEVEKLEVLQKLGLVSVKVECLGFCES